MLFPYPYVFPPPKLTGTQALVCVALMLAIFDGGLWLALQMHDAISTQNSVDACAGALAKISNS